MGTYSISQEICTRFCCALLCCGYAIVHNEFTWSIYPYFAGTGAIVRLPQCQWSKPDGYGKISQCITTTKHSKAKTVCIFLGIYCRSGSTLALVMLPSSSKSLPDPVLTEHQMWHSPESNRPVSQIRAPPGGLSRTNGKLWQDYSNCYMFWT